METKSNIQSSSPEKPALKQTPPLQQKIQKRNSNKDADRKPKDLIYSSKNEDTKSYLDSFPAGYRFCPHDEELVVYYLNKKLMNEPLPPNKINEINIYQYNPYELAEMYKGNGDKEIYFFTPRDRKYRNGSRPNRAAGDGYWKATGADKSVKFNGDIVGFKKALVFYQGKPPKGDKTNWIMHEYRVISSAPSSRGENNMRLDDWVLCRIYKKVIRSLKSRHKKEDEHSKVIEKTDQPMSVDGSNGNNSVTSNTYTGYIHHPFQQNVGPQMPAFFDLPPDNVFNIADQFQLDADMFFGYNYSDQFWNTYPENFSFEQLDLTNRFEDSLNIKNPNDKPPK